MSERLPDYPPHVPAALIWVMGVFMTLLCSSAELVAAFTSGSQELMSAIVRCWARAVLRLCKVEVTVHGRENLPAGPLVLIANHESFFDICAILGYLPGNIRMVAKSSLFRIPIFGWAMRRMGHISVQRTRRAAAVRDLQVARERLGEGIVVVVFAEGTRTASDEVLPFKKGGAVLAIETGAAAVPLAIEGSREVLPRGAIDIRPGRIDLYLLPPVPTAGMGYADRGRLTAELRERVVGALSALGPPPPCRRPLRR